MKKAMVQGKRIRGVLAPVVTPFKSDLSPDPQRLIAHCRWLLSQNCGLAVFGTNSEANSLSLEERAMLLDQLIAAGVDPSRTMPGTGCCSIMETVKLTAQAVGNGCAGVLMLPPFYYKDVSEEGLYRYFSEVVQRVGDARLKIYLYHIPLVAMVGITTGLVERLLADYADQQQSKLNVVREVFSSRKFPSMIAALKQAIAIYADDPAWRTVRPPLVELTPEQTKTLTAELKAIGFAMPGVRRVSKG